MKAQGPFAAALIRSARKAHAAGMALRLQGEPAGSVASFGVDAAQGEGLVDHLVTALAFERPALFREHVAWLQSSLAERGVPLDGLKASLPALRAELEEGLPANASKIALEYVDVAIARLCEAPAPIASSIEKGGPHADRAGRYLLALLEGRREVAIQLALAALEGGLCVADLHEHVLAAAQFELGRMWQRGEIHVAEEHMASRITEAVLAAVERRTPPPPPNGRCVLVTSASGDLHEIGLRMVAHQFEMAGFEVIFLGASTPPADVARAVSDFDVDLVAIAARLTLHLHATVEMIAALRASERAGKRVPILVGGGPFLLVPDLWRVVGADGSARNATEAVETGLALVAARNRA